MKLFAPKNNWSMTDPDSWWSQVGSYQTPAGISVSEDSALALTALSCGIRVISETLASLPLNLVEQQDYRTTRKATDHPLWRLVHDQPNHEQDIMTHLDSQISLQVGWGNAFSEIQREAADGIAALWPIHPSRIPSSNICRNSTNPRDWHQIVAGQPGELVYHVNNDDGTCSPIPASDMLHVPGVLSRNGITGQSIVRLGKNAIGISLATEEHAGAFFRNGAVPNIAIKSPKIVGKEMAERLRQQWQTVFGGVRNHYKTVLLEDGMEPVPFFISPEASQLVLSRQFNVTEVARLLRLPPHMVGDLARSTWSNIETQSLELIVYSLMPWIVRWEKAMYRQLLNAEEKLRYKFKFNVMGLLRGDQAARSAFFTAMFNMGVFSVNDIREYEDLNPVKDGDQRFVPANNLVPLDMIGELAKANLKKLQAPPPVPALPAPETDETDKSAEASVEVAQLRAEMFALILKRDDADDVFDAFQNISDRADARDDEFSQKLKAHRDGVREMLLLQQETIGSDVKSLVDAVKSHQDSRELGYQQAMNQHNEEREPIIEQLDKIVELIEKVDVASDTSLVEVVAVREVKMAAKQAEIQAQLTLERDATIKMLTRSLKKGIDSLMGWETKSLGKAIEKPTELPAWRAQFYPRFVKQFSAELGDLVDDAAACGVTLDLAWGADRYAAASIHDLKTIDQDAADNHYDSVRAKADYYRKELWKERSQVLAGEIVERGRRDCTEKDGES